MKATKAMEPKTDSQVKAKAANTIPVDSEEIFKVAQQMPRFPGCEEIGVAGQELSKCAHGKMFQYIQSNLKYPKEAREKKITGTAVVQFIVGKDGAIRDATLLRDLDSGCGAAALEMVQNMPNWVPGKHQGKVVPVQYSLPVNFRL